MPCDDAKVSNTDIVLVATALIGLLIVILSLYEFFYPLRGGSFDKDKLSAYSDVFDVVVKSTLLPLFTVLLTTKVGYSVAKFFLRKLSDRE